MSLQLATITASIAALDVAGVNIRGIDAIPESLTTRGTPALFPEPNGFVTNFIARHASFDSGADAPKTVEYDLTYTFCFAPVGTARSILDIYGEMLRAAFAVWDAILAHDAIAGAIDFQPKNNLYFGLVVDPAGGKHHGCQFIFHVKEFVN